MPALHTISRPKHTATMAKLLAALTTSRTAAPVDVPGGRVSAKRFGGFGPRGYFDRIAVFSAGREDRAALLTASGVDAAALGAIVAAVISNTPTGHGTTAAALYGHGSTAALSAESLHTVSRMRRDNRTPGRKVDGSACWQVPGAAIRVDSWSLTVTTETGEVRVSLDGREWTERDAAAVLDAALWQLAPLARHMTRTSAERGRRRLSDVMPGAIGRDRGAGTFADRLSTAACSCGWQKVCDNREYARYAANEHAAEHAGVATPRMLAAAY